MGVARRLLARRQVLQQRMQRGQEPRDVRRQSGACQLGQTRELAEGGEGGGGDARVGLSE